MQLDSPKNMTAQQRIGLMRRAEQAIAFDPKNADAYKNMGALLYHEKRFIEAAQYYAKALSLRKKDASIIEMLIEAHLEAKDYSAARKHARKLIEIEPRNPRFLAIQADVLEKMGLPGEALAALNRALKIKPDDLTILRQMASCHRAMGDREAVARVQAEIRRIEPHDAESLYAWANSFKPSREEGLAMEKQMMEAFEHNTDPVPRANMLYAAGKVAQDIGEYERAFEHFMAANAIRAPERPRDITPSFTNNRLAFSRNLFALRRGFGDPTDQPIFILGMPRSGTTLAESIVTSHSQVSQGDELAFMEMLARPLGISVVPPDLYVENIEAITAEKALEKARQYLESTKNVHGTTPHFTDKLPHNFLRMGLIRLLFPNAKIIHCRRHPVDNCLSIFSNSMLPYHNVYKTDLKTLGLYYRQYWQLMEHWREVLPGGFHEILYEDVVANTELNARKMIEYLGLEWEDGVMDREGSQRSVRTLSAWQVRQPVYTSSAGRWKVYEKQLVPLLEALGPIVGQYEAELAALDAEPGA